MEVRFANHRSVTIPKTSEGPREKFLFEHTQGLYQWQVMSALRMGNHVKTDVGRSLSAQPSIDENHVDHEQPIEHASKVDQVHGAKSTSHIAAQSADAAVDALHRRLHIGQDLIKKLPQITADAPANLQHGRTHSCAACLEANATRLSHKGSRYQPSRVGHAVILKRIHGVLELLRVGSHTLKHQIVVRNLPSHAALLLLSLGALPN